MIISTLRNIRWDKNLINVEGFTKSLTFAKSTSQNVTVTEFSGVNLTEIQVEGALLGVVSRNKRMIELMSSALRPTKMHRHISKGP